MVTALRAISPDRAEIVLSNLIRTLLPDASQNSKAQQLLDLAPLEQNILLEISERLGLSRGLPAEDQIPAVLEFLSREVSNVVLSKANVDDLQARTFDKDMPRQESRPRKARVFISSSNEGLEYAHAIQDSLEMEALTELWTEKDYSARSYALEGLIRDVSRFDFAAFVLTPDDVASFRGTTGLSRSNIAFEAGLFVGRLGANRTFFVLPKRQSGLSFLGDLAGILTLTYDPSSDFKDAALASASHEIAAQIRRFGPIGSKLPALKPAMG